MTTAYPSPESYAVFNVAGQVAADGRRRCHPHPCQPHHRQARAAGRRDREPRHRRSPHHRMRHPRVDRRLDPRPRTGPRCRPRHGPGNPRPPCRYRVAHQSDPASSRIGNLLHPVDTADIAALDGRHVAEPVRAYLRGQTGPSDGIRILAEPPLRWISPGILRPGDIAPARNRLLLWTDTLVRIPRIVVRQDGNVIARKTLPWPASPGRVFRVPSSVLDKVNAHGGPVTLSLGINGGSDLGIG